MTPTPDRTTYVLTLGVEHDPADIDYSAITKMLAGYIDGNVIGHSSPTAGGAATFTLTVQRDGSTIGNTLGSLEHFFGAALATVQDNEDLEYRVTRLSALTADELQADAERQRAIRSNVIGTDEFRELLAPEGAERISRQRLHTLSQRPEFPRAVGRGIWLRHMAERYAAERNTKPGRPASAPTTSYGTWVQHGDGGATLQQAVEIALEDHVDAFDVEALTDAYREAINADLADTGIAMRGDEFYGDAPVTENCGELIVDAIAAVDFWSLAPKYAKES